MLTWFVPKVRDTELLIFRTRLEEVSFSFSLSLGICKIKRGTAWNGVLNTVTRFYKFYLKWNHTCDNRVYYFAEREMIARKGKKRNEGKPYTVLEHGLSVSKNFFRKNKFEGIYSDP